MRRRQKTFIEPERIGAVSRFAILLAIGLVFVTRALAQSPATTTAASVAPSAVFAPSSAPSVSTAAPAPHANSTSSTTSVRSSVAPTDPQTVISYLSEAITWYRHLGVEAELVREPEETLFFADDRQVAQEILSLAFAYARAQAEYIAKVTGNSGVASGAGPRAAQMPGVADLQQKSSAAAAEVATLQARIKTLQPRIAAATGRARTALMSELATAQSELDLAQARSDAIAAMLQFESGSVLPEQNGGLAGQIDELERSIPDSERNPKRTANAGDPRLAPAGTQPSGIFSLLTDLFTLGRKQEALEQTSKLSTTLAARAASVRAPMLQLLQTIDRRGVELAQGTAAADVATLRDRKKAFEALLDEHKLVTAATLPLSKQIVLLELYVRNLARWRGATVQRSSAEIRSLVIRLTALGAIFALIFLGAMAWKWLTNRYVQDVRRRGQVMAARRLVLGLIVLAVVVANFSEEIGSAATVLGFAAAGIAVALQNVILSIAGYFFLIGRFGIKAGDRVQIGGVTGDVIDIGLVKLSLMELGGTGAHRQPTGRVVVFSNAIVFQPTGNFFKQAPGTSFVWNEMHLTFAPDCDYRLAEKRLLDAVDEVFARYRDRVMRDYRHLERDLNLMLETPKPQSRLSISPAGVEMTVRYPAETRTAGQIADEVSRRVLDAINREPSLLLATQGVANIQAQTPSPTPSDGSPAAEQPVEK